MFNIKPKGHVRTDRPVEDLSGFEHEAGLSLIVEDVVFDERGTFVVATPTDWCREDMGTGRTMTGRAAQEAYEDGRDGEASYCFDAGELAYATPEGREALEREDAELRRLADVDELRGSIQALREGAGYAATREVEERSGVHCGLYEEDVHRRVVADSFKVLRNKCDGVADRLEALL